MWRTATVQACNTQQHAAHISNTRYADVSAMGDHKQRSREPRGEADWHPRRLPHATGHHQLGHSFTFFPFSIKPRPLTNYDVAQQHRCCYLFERNVIFLIPAKKSDRSNVNMPKHTPKHTFKCSICRQHFTSKHNAERHKAKQHNLHGGPPSFQCPKCDKTLSRSYDLI